MYVGEKERVLMAFFGNLLLNNMYATLSVSASL